MQYIIPGPSELAPWLFAYSSYIIRKLVHRRTVCMIFARHRLYNETPHMHCRFPTLHRNNGTHKSQRTHELNHCPETRPHWRALLISFQIVCGNMHAFIPGNAYEEWLRVQESDDFVFVWSSIRCRWTWKTNQKRRCSSHWHCSRAVAVAVGCRNELPTVCHA